MTTRHQMNLTTPDRKLGPVYRLLELLEETNPRLAADLTFAVNDVLFDSLHEAHDQHEAITADARARLMNAGTGRN